MKTQRNNPFESGLMIIVIPIMLLGVVIAWWTHDSRKGWDFYASANHFIFEPLFQPLEKAVEKN
jgi:hypothetical protein